MELNTFEDIQNGSADNALSVAGAMLETLSDLIGEHKEPIHEDNLSGLSFMLDMIRNSVRIAERKCVKGPLTHAYSKGWKDAREMILSGIDRLNAEAGATLRNTIPQNVPGVERFSPES